MIRTSLDEKNEFPEGKYVWAQQAKLYVRLLPEKSVQYFLNKKWDIAKVVLSITVKRTN